MLGWPVLLPSCTNERRKQSFHLVGVPVEAAFRRSLDGIGGPALTIEHSVMSDPVGVVRVMKLLKGAVDQVSWANSCRSGNTGQRNVGLVYTRLLGKLINFRI